MRGIYNLRYEDELTDAVDREVICNERYCPFHSKHMSSPSNPTCEGAYCEVAFEKYLEERV